MTIDDFIEITRPFVSKPYSNPMSEQLKKEDIAGYECRFAVYCPAQDGSGEDIHLVKEVVHFKDGSKKPSTRILHNWKRPFWITKKGMRRHKDKKEWEKLEHVDRFMCTQSDLPVAVARGLGEPWLVKSGRVDMRRIARNPYVYGTDILSTAILKRSYLEKYPELITPYSMAAFDVETDVVHGTGEITMATLSFGSRVFTAVQKSFVSGQANVIERLQEKLVQYLGKMTSSKEGKPETVVDFITKRKIQWEVILVDSEIDVIKQAFARAHEWKPDFVAIWNIDFDMPKMLKAMEKAGVDPKDIFSDPSVPPKYRHFRYKQGSKQKVTASGKVTPVKPSAQWHVVFSPSSFYFIDAMCSYRQIRTGSAEEPSYALDAILQKHLGVRKLKFEQADGLAPLEWHQFMQSQYPLEYIIYNVFDCVSMEELDEETNDLSLSLPMFSGCSDFENFNKQPRRLSDNLHFFCLENGKVMASTSDQMTDELDELTVGLDGWIVTLPAHLVVDNGLRNIEENPTQATNIRGHVGDLDVSASYPNGGSVFNISKETTRKEIVEIKGVPEYQQRMQGINLSAGHTNAVEFCTNLFGLPTMEAMLQAFETHNARAVQSQAVTPKLQEPEF